MTHYFKILAVIAAIALAFYTCSGDDNSGTTVGINLAPASFSVSALVLSETTATLSWTEALDPNGDAVTYSVTLQDVEIASELSVLSLDISDLSPSTNYTGTVFASDGNGGVTSTDFSFSTDLSMATLHPAFAEFDVDNTNIMLSGSSVIIESNGLANHTSPYWSNTTERVATDPMGNTLVTPAAAENHPLFVEPTVTTYEMMAPGNIDDFNGSYSLTISANPQLAASSTATGLGPIGIAISGAMIYNDEEGPGIPLNDAVGSLDYTAAHTGPQSYHYHLETKAWSNDDEALIGVIADGFFLYGRRCSATNDYPTDLDASGGHTSTTQHSDGEEEYHYHIQNELFLGQFYILFPGDYQGTPSNIQ